MNLLYVSYLKRNRQCKAGRCLGVTLLGGVSSEEDIILGSEEKIRAAARCAIREMAPGDGFILASSVGLWRNAPWENVAVFIDEAQKAGAYR